MSWQPTLAEQQAALERHASETATGAIPTRRLEDLARDCDESVHALERVRAYLRAEAGYALTLNRIAAVVHQFFASRDDSVPRFPRDRLNQTAQTCQTRQEGDQDMPSPPDSRPSGRDQALRPMQPDSATGRSPSTTMGAPRAEPTASTIRQPAGQAERASNRPSTTITTSTAPGVSTCRVNSTIPSRPGTSSALEARTSTMARWSRDEHDGDEGFEQLSGARLLSLSKSSNTCSACPTFCARFGHVEEVAGADPLHAVR